MSIYLNVIGISKYVIKRLYITPVTQFHGPGLSSAMTVITKTKAPEASN